MKKNYYYIVNAKHKIVCENYCSREDAEILAKFSGCALYDHFPYKEYGYEDPYSFIAEWSVYSNENFELKVKLDWKNKVVLEEGI